MLGESGPRVRLHAGGPPGIRGPGRLGAALQRADARRASSGGALRGVIGDDPNSATCSADPQLTTRSRRSPSRPGPPVGDERIAGGDSDAPVDILLDVPVGGVR